MNKYRISLLVLLMIMTGIWMYSQQKVVEVMVPVEDFSVYDDVAKLAMDVGDFDIAKKYIDKSGNTKLLDYYERQKMLRDKVLESIDKALEIKPASKAINDVFKRLVSLESLDSNMENTQDIVLLVARMSVEQGFKGWDAIANQLEYQSQQIEASDPELAVIMYEISQFRKMI